MEQQGHFHVFKCSAQRTRTRTPITFQVVKRLQARSLLIRLNHEQLTRRLHAHRDMLLMVPTVN